MKKCFKYTSVELKENLNSLITNGDCKQIKDQINRAIAKYQLHPNILIIKNKLINPYIFHIEPATLLDIER